jgi:hypothetical protein
MKEHGGRGDNIGECVTRTKKKTKIRLFFGVVMQLIVECLMTVLNCVDGTASS